MFAHSFNPQDRTSNPARFLYRELDFVRWCEANYADTLRRIGWLHALVLWLALTLGSLWARLSCHLLGHDMQDHSYCTPDTGVDSQECKRCGDGWHVILY